ncbi:MULTISPECIES: isocitrate lyase/phosphoenolpyruvate mutase family protein [Rhodomicrobium]|uniref:isocitrate lyase/PEP mutase family protein n=1 Tax=Rhodomicrobium TaxID=1068 RepID=UPI000B4C2012|nr:MULTISPECIES: isocitrate lyase/phosphoenolpyruvate mutase family protein [Rhodomicrobium]
MPDARASSTFRDLHHRRGAFIIPNPWDVGSAKILASMGFEALATTSAGYAFSLGRKDGGVGAAEMLDHCRAIVAATPLPVSADLEKGFGDTPHAAADTIRQAAATGLAGASLEDFSGDRGQPIFDFALAVERIAAASETARNLGRDFVLTARAENFLHGRPDLDDTIKRLQAFEAAGADVLYAPGLRSLEQIRTVCASVAKPVNVLMPGAAIGLAELEAAGAKRVSVGSGLARLAYGALIAAARQMREEGSFAFAGTAASFAEIEGHF